jgi:hypothetical protein
MLSPALVISDNNTNREGQSGKIRRNIEEKDIGHCVRGWKRG